MSALRKMGQSLRRHYRDNRGIYILILFFFIIGLASGIATATQVSPLRRGELSAYFSNVSFAARRGEIRGVDSFWQSALHNFRVTLVMAIGAVSIPMLMFCAAALVLEGFIFGFSAASMGLLFGFRGIMYTIVILFPAHIIAWLCFFEMGCACTRFAIKSRTLKRNAVASAQQKALMSDWLLYMLILFAGTLIASLLNMAMMPQLMKLLT
ncbi:MAG: stage II sporulation protein M [Christensenellales bacterium]|jgi:stage II sporulation protein M